MAGGGKSECALHSASECCQGAAVPPLRGRSSTAACPTKQGRQAWVSIRDTAQVRRRASRRRRWRAWWRSWTVSRRRPAARASRRRRCACNQAHKEQHSLPPQLESPVQRAAEEAPAERIRAQAVQRPCCARARALLVCDCRRAASWRALRFSCSDGSSYGPQGGTSMPKRGITRLRSASRSLCTQAAVCAPW